MQPPTVALAARGNVLENSGPIQRGFCRMSDTPITTPTTQEPLWTGVDLKQDHARFHLEQMSAALRAPDPTGAVYFKRRRGEGHEWHRPFYAHLDAFLTAARSIPELIQCCFGHDLDRRMEDWFSKLSGNEQGRRKLFRERFKDSRAAFRRLPLENARHISEHRMGFPPATVTTFGLLGVTYEGSPIKRVPTSETPPVPEPYSSYARPVAVDPPRKSAFEINGQPLFAICEEYVVQSQKLIDGARVIAREVHGPNGVTAPESDV